MPRPQKRVEVRRKFLINANFLAILALIIVTITLLYISQEHNFHWWIDWHSRALGVAYAFRESPWQGIQLIQKSLVEERNLLYTLPLVPFFLTFGSSRLVYEISLALVYLFPFALTMGAIANQLIRVYPQTVFWSTTLLTLLLPVSWVSTFIGIPDTGGALFIALATLVYLQDIKLKQWWRIPVMGLFIGLSILLRRHFAYGGIAVLGALSLQALIFFAIEVRKNPPIALRNVLLFGVRIGLIAAISFATMMVVAPEFTQRAIAINYKAYHASWSLPFRDIFSLYAWFYGLATWLMVAIGFSAAIVTRAVALPALSFLGLSGVLSLIIWLVVLRYGNVFYSLHITPLVVIGLVAFFWTSWSRLQGKQRTIMLSVAGCYLTINLVFGLTPVGQFNTFFRPFFAVSMPPLVRTDYDEVVRLMNYLRQIAPNREPIYVVGYQRLQLDPSLLRAADWLLVEGRDGKILNVLQSSLVDSRDGYPLQTLLQAEYVVVPNPLPAYPKNPTEAPVVGEWLPDTEVEVVQFVFDAFTQNWELAQDFQRLPVQFTLEGNAVVSIYKRIRPTSPATAVRTLDAMQQYISDRSAGQEDWISLSPLLQHSFADYNPNNTYRLAMAARKSLQDSFPATLARTTHHASPLPTLATSFLYIGTLPDKAEVTGEITFLDKPCVKSSLLLAMLDREAEVVSTTETELFPERSPRFKLTLHGKNSAYLLLDVLSYDENNLINSCTIVINSLEVTPKK